MIAVATMAMVLAGEIGLFDMSRKLVRGWDGSHSRRSIDVDGTGRLAQTAMPPG
jgi:hypothetical protein